MVVVTYSSISTNSFEPYGECLMGTRGTMVVEAEQKVMLYTEKDPTKARRPADDGRDGRRRRRRARRRRSRPRRGAARGAGDGGGQGGGGRPAAPISRGYREEMEDFAYCVRLWDAKQGYEKKDGKYAQRLPRCHGEVAMADAIIALTANAAMKTGRDGSSSRTEWFDGDDAACRTGTARRRRSSAGWS